MGGCAVTLLEKLAGAAILLAGLYAAHAWDRSRAESAAYAAGQAEVQGRWQAAQIEAQRAAIEAEQRERAKEQAKIKAAQEAVNATRKQAQRDRAAADAARSELGRLRDELAARDAAASGGAAGGDSGPGCVVDAGATERELLRACAAEYQALAADADGVRARLLGLQEWVRGVCVSPEWQPAPAPGR